nr:MAG TPA: DNA helix destabilizing protein [Caudoviricetes sp.]
MIRMENLNGTRVTVRGRLSYVHVFKPHASVPGAEEKYSTTILVPKTDVETKQKIDAAIKAATELGVLEKWNGVKPPTVPNPIWDGDGVKQNGEQFGPECKGHWVFTASAKADYPPQVVDRRVQPILDQSEIYSGCYANVAVNFFPYLFAGKKGIGAGLGNIQKIKDGESLAGTRTAEQDFAVVDDEDDALY